MYTGVMRRLALFACLCPVFAQSQTAPALIKQVRGLPGVVEVKDVQGRHLDISFQQPVDHANPNGPKFVQHVFLLHRSFDKPMLLGTEGYTANDPGGSELVKILGGANQLTVEHRYFGRSIPKKVEWKHLTVKNAAADMHRIVQAFKRMYKTKWVASGVSKGGQTTLFFKTYYPNDVDVSVPYVAPVNVHQEDPRINLWMETVGDPATRDTVRAFQLALLKRRDEVLPLMEAKPADFSMGVEKAYEYGVLEFPYAFWQYGSNREPLPKPDAPATELAATFRKVNPMFWYRDDEIKQFGAFYYQAFTEIGYYNYDLEPFRAHLKHKDLTNQDLCPPATRGKIVYNPATLAHVFSFLQYKANRVVYIYGETDAWSATQMHLIGRTDAVKIVVKGAWHNASIRLASPDQRKQVFDALDRWLGMKVVRD